MPARSDSASRFARFLDGKPKSATFPCAPAEGSLRLDRDEALGYLGYGDQELDCELAARFNTIGDAFARLLVGGICHRVQRA